MAKKGGKTSTKAAASKATETQEKQEKQINLLVKTDNISERTTSKDGKDKTFMSCRIPVMIDAEKGTQFGSIPVDKGRVTPATKPIKDEKGEIVRTEDGKAKTEPIEGYSNVWLRGESSKIKLNVQDGKDENGKFTYKEIEATAGQIKEWNDAAKKAYKAAQNSKDKTVENDGVAAPEAEAEEQADL